MNIGKNIARIRDSLGLSQAEFARRIGVGRSAVWNWENNQARPDLANILKIAALGNVAIEDILKAGVA